MKSISEFIKEGLETDNKLRKEFAIDLLDKALPRGVTYELVDSKSLDYGMYGFVFSRELTDREMRTSKFTKWLDNVTYNNKHWVACTGGGNVVRDNEIVFNTKQDEENVLDFDFPYDDGYCGYADFDEYWSAVECKLIRLSPTEDDIEIIA